MNPEGYDQKGGSARNREAALGYARRGLKVFPCSPTTKRPLIAWKAGASSDERVVADLWSRFPDAAVGRPTGGGTVVIDIDVEKGGEVDPKWPTTLTATTPSGGRHLFFAGPEAARIPCSVERIAPGVDVRGDGGMVLLPGTPGREWIDPDAPMAALPTSLLEAIRAPSRKPGGFGPGFSVATHVGSGARNDYVARFVGYAIRNGFEEEGELVELAQAHNVNVCDPPLSACEVERTCKSILTRHNER